MPWKLGVIALAVVAVQIRIIVEISVFLPLNIFITLSMEAVSILLKVNITYQMFSIPDSSFNCKRFPPGKYA